MGGALGQVVENLMGSSRGAWGPRVQLRMTCHPFHPSIHIVWNILGKKKLNKFVGSSLLTPQNSSVSFTKCKFNAVYFHQKKFNAVSTFTLFFVSLMRWYKQHLHRI